MDDNTSGSETQSVIDNFWKDVSDGRIDPAAEREISHSVAAVHYHRNALIPIACLPPEILARILVLHAQTEPPDRYLDGVITSIRVCKRWWQVGMGCPELWSYIRFISHPSMAWLETMLERSRTAPLSFEVGVPSELAFPELEANMMTLCKSLSIYPFSSQNLYSFFRHSTQPAPLLQHLKMAGLQPGGLFAFPPDFLRGRTPNLRHVQLNTCSHIPWHSALFTDLIYLEVCGWIGLGAPDESSVEMLLGALARMPTLEVLFLSSCFSRTMPSTRVVTHVHLPNLRMFRITGTLDDCACFLGQITVNPTAAVRVNIRSLSISKVDVGGFFAVFSSHLCTTSPLVVQALQFTWQDDRELVVDAWTAQQPEDAAAATSSFHVSFKCESWNITPLDLAWLCFTALASPQLRSFRMLGDSIVGWDAEVWRELALAAPDLQRLSPGRGASSAELCKALRPPDGSDLAPADCCLPALSYLEFGVPYDFPMPTSDGGEAPLSTVLARSLAARAAAGCSTPELVFLVPSRCSLKGRSEPFRDAVPGIVVREGHDQGESPMASPSWGDTGWEDWPWWAS
ncbi:hypothetical protein BD779DRAFT_1575952 [Infundibulicybe gibba]|nr:hypothetical protein BD779DRAFT_1575952 [Infundibulicybe gibba]